MDVVINPGGICHCIYSETINLSHLGRLSIKRGSHVEPDDDGKWIADLGPVKGPRLGPFENRSLALQAEMDWLTTNWLPRQASS
jgi:hypothetical protein